MCIRDSVEDDELRLLAEGPGKQDALPLAVADGLEGPVGKVERVGLAEALLDVYKRQPRLTIATSLPCRSSASTADAAAR